MIQNANYYRGSNSPQIKHLSASSINRFRECPMAFYGKYIYRWPEYTPPMRVQAYAMGSAVHAGLEAHHKGQDAITALCRYWGTIRMPMPADVFTKAVKLLQLYTATEQPDPRDIVERKFSLTVAGIDVPIIGFIDRQRGLTVREYKTTGSKTWWTQERADSELQMALYLIAVSRENRGAQATGEYHILSHREPMSHTILTTTRNKAQQEEALESVRETWGEIQKGELNAACKPGQCRYPTRCREYGYRGSDSVELPVEGDIE